MKPFAQEAELAEKLDRLAELNALLNMDEKGDEAVDMDDETPKQEQTADRRQDGQTEKEPAPAHSNVSYVDNTATMAKASEPKVDYAAKKPEKAESGRPFHDKLEAKKEEAAQAAKPTVPTPKDKNQSL